MEKQPGPRAKNEKVKILKQNSLPKRFIAMIPFSAPRANLLLVVQKRAVTGESVLISTANTPNCNNVVL